MTVRIDVGKNKEALKDAWAFFQSLGYKTITPTYDSITFIIDGNDDATFILFDDKHIEYARTTFFEGCDTNDHKTYGNLLTLELKKAASQLKEVKLNKEHVAFVSKDKQIVTVGCQKIPAAKVLELAQLLK